MPKSPYVYDPTAERGPGLYRRLANRLNPFYFGSAVLILYGICLVLEDDRLLDDHASKLLFNFSSLQLYELCLILFALLLIRRRIINDSLMLVVIEQVLLLVPFMLFHGGFFTPGLAAISFALLPVAAIGLCMRWAMLARRYPGINLPRRLWLLGLPALAVNIALPLIYWYRFDRGTPDFKDDMFMTLEVFCYGALPVLFALPLLLGRKRQWAVEAPGQPWLPFLGLTTWAGMTLFHLAWIPYVYDLDRRFVLFIPAIWMLAWTFNGRLPDLTNRERPWARMVLLVLPALTGVLVFLSSARSVCRWLTILNVIVYVCCAARRHYPRLSIWLALGSAASLLATLPSSPAPGGLPAAPPVDAAPPTLAITGLLLLVFLVCLPFRKTYATTAGAISLGLLVIRLCGGVDLVHSRGIAMGAMFFLLHSLRWREDDGWVTAIRATVASSWLVCTAALALALDTWEPVLLHGACALPAFIGYAFIYALERRRDVLFILIPCVGLLSLTPIRGAVSIYRNCGPGPATVLAAFVMLLIGTIEAVRRTQTGNGGVESC